MSREIVVVPFPHPGHLFPATELCNRLAARNYKITLFFPSSSSPSSLSLHPLVTIVELSIPDSINFQPPLLEAALVDLIDKSFSARDSFNLPICAVIDEMIGWIIDPFLELKIPVVSFFTSSASSAALEHAMEQISPHDLTPGKILTVPGLPTDMALTASSLAARRGPPHRHNGGRPRRGLPASDGAIALLYNTCDDLERPFLDYVAKAARKPVWGVGPLLPAPFWAGAGSPVRDGDVRSKLESDVSEREVIDWLDSKPRGSVIYVAFGSLVSPSEAQLAELAAGLEESNRPFLWVVKPGAKRHDSAGRPTEGESGCFFPEGLGSRVGKRGLVIRGWAPQLLILRHPSTGGYLCHCGWNSTVEALGCGVPMLTWPVRGDQIHNAKLVTSLLKVGLPMKGEGGQEEVRKDDVVQGIERLMADDDIKKRAAEVGSIFADGFPATSAASLDCFLDFLGGGSER